MGVLRDLGKRWLPPALADLLRHTRYEIPDAHLYKPLFSPWLGLEPFAGLYRKISQASLVSADRCWVLYNLATQAMNLPGSVWEIGVYRGGTAALLRDVIAQARNGKSMHLFDTFEGMPETDSARDLHKKGDFSDTSLDAVRAIVGPLPWIQFHKGHVPATFAGLEAEAIAFAHIDVDIYRSVIDCCDFVYPRLRAGGFMVFDDYGFPSCPGARQAVDEFFSGKPETPLILSTGQAVVFKLAAPPECAG
jgi:O-methyltransferase